jgi:hypothetical protein
MERPRIEVADILRRFGAAYRAEHETSVSTAQRRVMRAITACRTAALGGHVEQCDACQHQRIAYNSCRNRHCPKCQSLTRAQWIEKRQSELLDCPYFHVVFTLPEEIAAIAYQNKAMMYNALFAATVLHTWGQNLVHHPHLHCVVPGGGLSADGQRWVACRDHFFLPVRVLSRFFRRRFMELLERAYDGGELQFYSGLESLRERTAFYRYLDPVRQKEWVVYAKAPFAGPEQVLDYVGRYTHRVAISNNRLLNIEEGSVTFRWKDYRDESAQKTMTLTGDEFIRRFLLHVLPSGLQRIRYFGLLGNRRRHEKLEQCRQLLQMPAPATTEPDKARDYRDRYEALTGISLHRCPVCQQGRMLTFERFDMPSPIPVTLDTS